MMPIDGGSNAGPFADFPYEAHRLPLKQTFSQMRKRFLKTSA
jgi:hypothetical protein